MAWTSTARTVARRKMPAPRRTSVIQGALMSSIVFGCFMCLSAISCANVSTCTADDLNHRSVARDFGGGEKAGKASAYDQNVLSRRSISPEGRQSGMDFSQITQS
jgi:hypothetical protein